MTPRTRKQTYGMLTNAAKLTETTYEGKLNTTINSPRETKYSDFATDYDRFIAGIRSKVLKQSTGYKVLTPRMKSSPRSKQRETSSNTKESSCTLCEDGETRVANIGKLKVLSIPDVRVEIRAFKLKSDVLTPPFMPDHTVGQTIWS
jgi:hypothetical protein